MGGFISWLTILFSIILSAMQTCCSASVPFVSSSLWMIYLASTTVIMASSLYFSSSVLSEFTSAKKVWTTGASSLFESHPIDRRLSECPYRNCAKGVGLAIASSHKSMCSFRVLTGISQAGGLDNDAVKRVNLLVQPVQSIDEVTTNLFMWICKGLAQWKELAHSRPPSRTHLAADAAVNYCQKKRGQCSMLC